MEKMTYAVALEVAINTIANEEAKEKLKALKTQLEKKANAPHKLTKTQTANLELEQVVFSAMEPGRAYSISELMKNIPELAELSNQKISAILRGLKIKNLVVREEVKGKVFFTVPMTEEEA